jgi:hypothetical protein
MFLYTQDTEDQVMILYNYKKFIGENMTGKIMVSLIFNIRASFELVGALVELQTRKAVSGHAPQIQSIAQVCN